MAKRPSWSSFFVNQAPTSLRLSTASGKRFPDLLAETVATPRGTIISSDQFGYDDPTIQRFIADGVVALDMETAAGADICEQRGMPWSAYRAISDRGDDET